MKATLTDKQKRVYDFIVNYIEEYGYPPTVRDICAALHYGSTATVQNYLDNLEKKGYIERGGQKNRSITITAKKEASTLVPDIGVVTAGVPITAIENIEGYFPLQKGYFEGHDHFILSVRGESMIDAGIYDGDKIIVNQVSVCRNGDIIVALVEDEATVKRYYREHGHVRLQPENQSMEPIIVDNIEVLGKVVGLFRKM